LDIAGAVDEFADGQHLHYGPQGVANGCTNIAELRAFNARVVRPFYELRQAGPGFEVAVKKAAMDILGHPARRARGYSRREDTAEMRKHVDPAWAPPCPSGN
jgi:hypothetical protein